MDANKEAVEVDTATEGAAETTVPEEKSATSESPLIP